jgi:hypothetical protein
MKQYPNPSATKRGWLELSKGLDLVNSLAMIDPQSMAKADNMMYRRGTLTSRPAFRSYSDEEISKAFTGAHSYIEIDGTEHILFSDSDGNLKDLDIDGSSPTRATGFSSTRVRFQSMRGACFSVDGGDLWRGDGDVWRKGGCPAYLTGATGSMAGSGSGTSLVGRYMFIVVPVIEASGIAIVKGDWSDIVVVDVTTAGRNITISWTASTDTRVTHYYIYRTVRDVGAPFFFDGKVTFGTNAYSSTATDLTLSATVSDSAGKNGIAPQANLITTSGQRLVLANLNGDESAVHLSAVATNIYEMESFPNDGIHRFSLPSSGGVTAIKGIGVKDEDSNRNDLFLAQVDSCFILRGTDPDTALETISGNVGVINPDAVVQWGGFLFFVSKRGVEFLGATGKPIMISSLVNPLLWGGGSNSLAGINGYSYLGLEVWDNKLLLSLRMSSENDSQDTILCLDLERFNADDPLNTAVWTMWNGLGFSYFVETYDRSLLLFDNNNIQLLKAEPASSIINYDTILDVDTPINCNVWTGAILGFNLDTRKLLRRINCFLVCDQESGLIIEADYGKGSESLDLVPISTTIQWDLIWDVDWISGDSFICSNGIGRGALGKFFQLKFNNNMIRSGFIFLGFSLYFTEQKNIILTRR